MKLKTLKARGFWGFKRGLGVDEITVDLSSLSGLVAITGDNGRGKTTLLELLHPYRQLASRNGNIKNHVFLRDSFKELTFDFHGAEYRTLIKIDCDSDRSEGFIFRNGESLVNGKLRDYDKKINEIFGSPELFFSSVFCAQNAAKLSDLTVGQIKGLFSEFLHLDRLEAYEQTAKRAGAIVSGLVAGKAAELNQLECRDVAVLDAELNNINDALTDISLEISTLEEKIVLVGEDASRAASAAAQNAVVLQKIVGLNNEHTTSSTNALDYSATANAELYDLRTKYHTAISELQKAETLASRAAELDAAEINACYCRGAIIAGEKKSLDNEVFLEVARTEIEYINGNESAAKEMLDRAKYDPKEAALHTEIFSCKAAMTVLEKRSPECKDQKCALIAAAVEASEKLPALVAQYDDLKKENAATIAQSQASIDDCATLRKAAAQRKADAESRIAASRAEIKAAKLSLAEYDAILNLSGDIAAAVERKSGIEARIDELKATGTQKKSDLEQRQIADANNITRLEALIESAQAELNHAADGDRMNAEAEISALKNTKHLTKQQLTSLQAQRETISAKLAEARAAEKKINILCSELSGLKSEASEWQYIQNACGANGLRALEIDGVAPCITGNANTLLAATYGPAFSVSIRTQDPETGKETFDIVITTEDGTETLLENLSGGQKCWLLMALRLAMTLVSKQKSEKIFETGFADELDGALDIEKATTFTAMYREYMRAGSMNSLYFITHKAECSCLADHNINFSEQGILVN